MKMTLMTLALVGSVALAPLAFAHEGGHGEGHGMKRVFKHKMGMEHLTKDLDLTPEQQAKAEKMKTRHMRIIKFRGPHHHGRPPREP